jgi:hypothetical protein
LNFSAVALHLLWRSRAHHVSGPTQPHSGPPS